MGNRNSLFLGFLLLLCLAFGAMRLNARVQEARAYSDIQQPNIVEGTRPADLRPPGAENQ